MTRAQALRRGFTILGVAYFALWACGPALSGPPPIPMAEGRVHEAGLAPHYGARVVTNRRGQTELSTECADELLFAVCGGPSLQAWYRHRAEHFDIGAVAFGGTVNLIGAGMTFRWRAYETDRFVVGVQADGGWLWASAGVPIAFGLSDRTWIGVHPQIAGKLWAPGRLGLSVFHTLPVGFTFGAEAAPGLSFEGEVTVEGGAYIGYQFGAQP